MGGELSPPSLFCFLLLLSQVQKGHLEAKRAAHAAVRAIEAAAAAAKFQSRFKGWLWRVKLRKMKTGAVIFQVKDWLCCLLG